MAINTPKILALDFDGVICDGLIEYFHTSKLVYEKIWNEVVSSDKAELFYKLRPVIEIGWEMPVLIRAIVKRIPEQDIFTDWITIAENIVSSEKLDKKLLGKTLDDMRDRAIASDLQAWLNLHRFYPGVTEKLQQAIAQTNVYIVTTKEGRFVKQLLHDASVELQEERIFGKECKQPKYQTIRQLMKIHNCQALDVWFVEDRLKALESVKQQPDLAEMGLYLAAWGYNTQATRDSISSETGIKLLSLEQFIDNFSAWH